MRSSPLLFWPFAVALLTTVTGATCKSDPDWQGVVEVTPIERPALGACGPGTITALGGKSLMRAPYLQSVSGDSAVVVWAAWPGEARRVEVHRPDQNPVTTATARYAGRLPRAQAVAALPDEPQETVAPDNFYLERADLSGLEPGRLYCYRLVSAAGTLVDWAPLQTAPAADADTPVEVAVLGDSGTGNAAQRAIAKRLEESPFELMLFLGDIAYKSGTPSQLQHRFFDIYQPFLQFVPAWPSLGNHEYRTRSGQPYLDAFVLPNNERWYSFDWGDTHFVALDTNRIGREQARWLDEDLSATDRRWVVVYGHHPPFTSAKRGPSVRFRRYFEPLIERHQVDLVLAGHEHQYERTKPISGTTYIVSGGGGGRLTGGTPELYTEVHRSVHHYLTLQITHDALRVRAIDIEGKTFDEVTLQPRDRQRPAPTP